MQLSFRLGVIFILLAAAAWGLGGVAGQFLFQFYDVGAPWLIAVRQIIAGVVFLHDLTVQCGYCYSAAIYGADLCHAVDVLEKPLPAGRA